MGAKYFIIIICVIAILIGCTSTEQPSKSKYIEIKEDIFACDFAFSGLDGKTHTICYDTAGKQLFDESYDILNEIGFSKEEKEKINKEFQQGCFNEVLFKDLPPSVITDAILKTSLFADKTICENIDKSIYFWNYDNYRHTYTKKYSSGGNFRGHYWNLEIDPHTTEGIAAEKYPFLACDSFSAHKMHAWTLTVEKENNKLKITTDNISPTEAEDLDAEGMNRIAKNFTNCSNKYDYYRLSKENTYN
jgi:hypothetical protein